MAGTEDNIELSELVGALSLALDLTEGQPPGHSLRCCWIGMHVGMALGLGAGELSDLYYTLLLKDIGCSSNAARICSLFVTDDLLFKRDAKLVNGGLPVQIRFALAHAGKGGSLSDRLRAMVKVALAGQGIPHELVDIRCHRGADIARRMRFSETVATAILDLDEHWNGRGAPQGLGGEAISLFARIALLAQVVDVFQNQSGLDAAMVEAHTRAGSWFDPGLVKVLDSLCHDKAFREGLVSPHLDRLVAGLEPRTVIRVVDEDYLDDIAAGFAEVVDAKSPFTSGHSNRVGVFAQIIAEGLGLDAARGRWLKRAGLLHDIGKLGVSNAVLDKPGKLDPDEWEAMRRHPGLGEAVLQRVASFREIAVIAGAHHERLDGRGYPRGLGAESIGLDTRIITTADVFDALTADRPYRKRMSVDEALAIMRADVGKGIDPACLGALERGMAEVEAAAALAA